METREKFLCIAITVVMFLGLIPLQGTKEMEKEKPKLLEDKEIYLLACAENKIGMRPKNMTNPINGKISISPLSSPPNPSFFLDIQVTAENNHNKVFRYYHARVLNNHEIVKNELWVTNGKVISPQEKADYEINVQGLIIAPGYIDLQVNGGFGVDFSRESERVDEVARLLPKYGVTSFLPTIVTVDKNSYPSLISHLQPHPCAKGATILGTHLEGPFFAPEKHGAHHKELVLPFTSPIEACYGDLAGVKIVTLAPEIPGALEAIATLKAKGIIISAGHTDASYDEMEMAVEAGVSMATHLFNAMRPLHHRIPGIAGAVLTNDAMAYSIIADGIHVHPAMIDLAWRSNPDGLFLVTDAIEALGLPPGIYHLGNREVEVNQETAYILGTKTIAGSVLSMDQAVRFFKESTKCSLVDALEAASLKPAQVLGIEEFKGNLNEGADADFIFLDENLHVQACIIGGRLAWKND